MRGPPGSRSSGSGSATPTPTTAPIASGQSSGAIRRPARRCMERRVDMEVIERALWNVMRPQGEAVETTVTVRPGHVLVEDDDGNDVAISLLDDGIDVRIGHIQLFVKG